MQRNQAHGTFTVSIGEISQALNILTIADEERAEDIRHLCLLLQRALGDRPNDLLLDASVLEETIDIPAGERNLQLFHLLGGEINPVDQ